MQHSIVEYLSEHDGYRCGYCGSPDSNFSHGMWGHTLTCQDYQDLIDRGWRRSGKYIYKPTMDKMCCPLYTIRCHGPTFKISKSQKKVLKRATKYLVTGDPGGGGGHGGGAEKGVGFDGKESEDHPPPGGQDLPAPPRVPQMAPEVMEKFGNLQKETAGSEVRSEVRTGRSPSDARVADTDQTGMTEQDAEVRERSGGDDSAKKQKKMPKQGVGPDPTKPPCKKAKLRRLDRRQEKLAKKVGNTGQEGSVIGNTGSSSGSKVSSEAKSLEEFIVDSMQGQEPKHRLELKLVRSTPMSTDFRQTLEESFQVYKKYQMVIHNDPESKCTLGQWKRFLVDSPLKEAYPGDGPECGYGSFHQHYVLDGKIIAVGVIDILPACTSSVYFYYDPEYRFLSLGTYSALRELAFTRSLHASSPSLQYYYLGYYVHSCRKMRYKGQYHPSYLLCPKAYTFHPIEECIPKLEVNKYSQFSPTDADDASITLSRVLVLHSNTAMTYHIYRQLRPRQTDEEEEVKEYAQMAGKTCAERMLLYRD